MEPAMNPMSAQPVSFAEISGGRGLIQPLGRHRNGSPQPIVFQPANGHGGHGFQSGFFVRGVGRRVASDHQNSPPLILKKQGRSQEQL